MNDWSAPTPKASICLCSKSKRICGVCPPFGQAKWHPGTILLAVAAGKCDHEPSALPTERFHALPPARQGAPVPRYFFNLLGRSTEPDSEGSEFPDIQAAQAAAVRLCGELIKE